MSRRVQLFRVDAFTGRPFAGNPAAVVPDASGLTLAQMQAITREQGVDTAFLLPPDGADHDLQVRFFTPRAEAGFVGHATLAAHAVLDALGKPLARRQKQRSGIVEIERIEDGEGKRFAFNQPPPQAPVPLAPDKLPVLLGALGLRADALDAGLPVVVAGSSSTRALIALRTGAALAPLQPDLGALAALSASGCPPGYFLYTLAPAVPHCDLEARMFCPAIGIPEDPVSGNAHAMLAAFLHAAGRWPGCGSGLEFTSRQGHHLGRPGRLDVRADAGAAGLRRVRVAGRATIVMEARLDLA